MNEEPSSLLFSAMVAYLRMKKEVRFDAVLQCITGFHGEYNYCVNYIIHTAITIG